MRDAQRRAAEAASAAAAAGARAAALSAAVERADGIAPSLAELVRRGATLALALVEPEAGYELAVAAALERCAALACADDLASALALLEAAEAEGGALHVGRPAAATAPAPAGAVPLEAHVRLAERAPSELLAGVWLVDDAAALLRVTSGIAVTRDGLGYDADRGVAFRSGASGEAALLRARRELEGAHAAAESTARRERAARGRGAPRRPRRWPGSRRRRPPRPRCLPLLGAHWPQPSAPSARRLRRVSAPRGQPSAPSTIATRRSALASS